MNKLCEIKDKLIDIVYEVVTTENVESIDAHELGEIIDVIKDIAEYNYYHSITDAMEESSTEEKVSYINKYSDARMHYSTMLTGKSGLMRKIYMENKDISTSDTNMKNLDNYISELGNDISEMIADLTTVEKQSVKQELSEMLSTIV